MIILNTDSRIIEYKKVEAIKYVVLACYAIYSVVPLNFSSARLLIQVLCQVIA